MTKMMDTYAQKLIEKHYVEKLKQSMSEALEAADNDHNKSFTMQKFYEKSKKDSSEETDAA